MRFQLLIEFNNNVNGTSVGDRAPGDASAGSKVYTQLK